MTGKYRLHTFLARLLSFALICALLPLGAAETAKADSLRNVTVQLTYGQTEARTAADLINTMRRTSSDAWYWNSSNSAKIYCSNLSTLTYDYALERVAMQRAAEIALSYSHTRPNGTNYYTAYSENGCYPGSYAENIGVNYSSASALHSAMREDSASYSGQEQRRNMLDSRFTAVGVGHVYYNGCHYWVEEFANTVTSATYTAPNNQTTTKSVSLLESYISSDQIVVPSTIGSYIQMTVGQTVDLSGCYESIRVYNHWKDEACPLTQTLNLSVSNTGVAYISSQKLVGYAVGSTTLTLSRSGSTLQKQIPVTVYASGTVVPSVNPQPSQPTQTTNVSSAVIGPISTQTYKGASVTPSVTVVLNGKTLTKDTDYYLMYSDNSTPGKATVTVVGTGNYTGSKTATFIIKPQKPAITRLRAQGSRVRVTWTQTSAVTGYEIYRSKGDGSYKKIARSEDGEMTTFVRNKLTKGTYHYKIRAYVTVDGKDYYSAFSKVKSVRIR